MNPCDVSAMILAGGYSSRMGRDKAELDWNGKTFLQLQIEKLQSIGIGDILLSGYPQDVEGTRRIPDLVPHKGPLSGIHACLKQAANSCCLAISVDVPLLPASLLEELIRAHEGGITMAVHGDGKWEPLMAVYDCSLADAAEEILATEKTALRRLTDRASVKLVCYQGEEMLLSNCNTPEDYEKLCRFDGRL